MKKQLIAWGLLAALLIPHGAFGAMAFVQSRTAEAGNYNTTPLAFLSNVTANNLVGVCAGIWNGSSLTTVGVTDSLGTSFTVVVGSVTGGVPIKPILAYGIAPSSGADTITIDPDVNGAYSGHVIFEFSDLAASPLDAAGTPATGIGTAPAASVTAVDAANLAIACMTHGASGTFSITPDTGAGWTQLGEVESNANAPVSAVYQIFGSSGVKTHTWTLGTSQPWSALAYTFKAGGATTQPMWRRGLSVPGMNYNSLGGPLP